MASIDAIGPKAQYFRSFREIFALDALPRGFPVFV
jgi:hypothetical protein